MSALLSLLLAITARLSPEQAISWLPADTETLLVIRKPGKMRSGEDRQLSGAEEVRSLAFFGLPNKAPLGFSYEFIVDGSRKFRPPKQLGIWPYEGCKVVGLKPAEQSRQEAYYRRAGKRITIEGQPAYEVSNMQEHDRWTYRVVFLEGLMLCATDRKYLAELLRRRADNRPRGALPVSLAEWNYIDRRAPLWLVRHVQPATLKGDGAFLMADPKVTGYAMMLDQAEKEFRVVSLSRDPKGSGHARKFWQEFFTREESRPSVMKKLSPSATQFIFDANYRYRGSLLFVVVAASGRPIFV